MIGVERLESRWALAALTPGNILVSNAPFNEQAMLFEYTPDGSLVQQVAVPQPIGSVLEKPRDIVVDGHGNVQIFNGVLDPRLTAFDPAATAPNQFSNVAFPTWSSSTEITHGGIAAVNNFVFVTDQRVPGENTTSRGLVRFNIDNLSSGWTRQFDPNIGDLVGNTSQSIPHLTIQATGDNTPDYFSFNVPNADSRGIFDIDLGDPQGLGAFTSALRLFDANGNLLAEDFDGSPVTAGGRGSTSANDAYLEYTFANPGNYVIQVGACCPFADVPGGAKYNLQVSIQGHSTFVPGGSGVLNEVEPNDTLFTALNTDSAERFGFVNGDTIDVTMGLDGKLYALVSSANGTGGGSRVDAYDPFTLQQVGSTTLPRDYRAIAVDQMGLIYAVQPGIHRFDPAGDLLGSIDNPGTGGVLSDIDITGEGQLVVASNNGNVIVSNTTFDSFSTFMTRPSTGTNFVAFVKPPLRFPDAVDDVFRVPEDSVPTSLNVLFNDLTDSRGLLTITSVSLPDQGGSATIAGGRSIRYVPAANFSGIERLTYTVSDGLGGSGSAEVAVNVSGVNENPVANSDSFTLFEDTAVTTLDVLSNDSSLPDPGETLTITGVGTPDHGGTVQVVGAATLSYKPAANFFGVERFSYTISDGNGGVAVGDVVVNVSSVNDNPIARPDTFAVAPNSNTVNLLPLRNDVIAPDVGETLTITAVSTPDRNGTAAIVGGTQVAYRPATNFQGVETFSYTINDGNGGTSVATITVNVGPVNNPPVLGDDTFFVRFNSQGAVLRVLSNDTTAPDVNETMSITAVTAPDNAGNAVIVNGGQAIRYSPATSFTGIETFTYTVTDSRGATETATVSINVGDYNTLPNATADTFIVKQNSVDFALDVLANDNDPDPADTLRLVSAGNTSQGGTVTVSADNTRLLYSPPRPFLGSETFTYVIDDGHGGTSTGTVVVDIRGWQNPANPLDVDKDGAGPPSPNDALAIINRLNEPVGSRLQAADGLLPIAPLVPDPRYNGFYDVSGDGYLTAIDVLLVINAYNALTGSTSGEGESQVAAEFILAPTLISEPASNLAASTPSPVAVASPQSSAPPCLVREDRAIAASVAAISSGAQDANAQDWEQTLTDLAADIASHWDA